MIRVAVTAISAQVTLDLTPALTEGAMGDSCATRITEP